MAGDRLQLEYDSTPAERWGPVLFRPSRRSSILLIMVIAIVAWITWRHEPWRFIGEFGGTGDNGLRFLRPGLLVLRGGGTPRHVRLRGDEHCVVGDPAVSGGTSREQARVVWDGPGRWAVLPRDGAPGHLLDLATGGVVGAVANPLRDRRDQIESSSDRGLFVITRENSLTAVANRPHLWKLTPGETDRRASHRGEIPHEGRAYLSGDGRRILLCGPPSRHLPAPLRLIETDTFAVVHEWDRAEGWVWASFWDGGFVMALHDRASGTCRVRVFDDARGPRASPAELRVRLPGAPTEIRAFILDDGRTCVMRYAGNHVTTDHEAFDLFTGGPVAWPPVAEDPSHTLGGDGRMVGASTDQPGRAGVFVLGRRRPLAMLALDLQVNFAKFPRSYVRDWATDGEYLAVQPRLSEVTYLFRRAGWECRESEFGVLGMPHALLLAVLLAALTASLSSDAWRESTARELWARRVGAVMVVAALPRFYWFLLDTGLGHHFYTLAPVTWVCGLGLITGSRAWRLAAVVALAGTVAVNAHALSRMGFLAIGRVVPHEVLERVYDVPAAGIAAVLLASAIAAGAGMVAVLRRWR